VKPNRNMLWASILVDELRRMGVQDAVLCPGSRNAPLSLALHEASAGRATRTSPARLAPEGGAQSTALPPLGLRVIVDERSAAYFAVGVAKATNRPVLLVTTSGTAAANALPAVIEADQSGVPLIVVTADRPPELRDVGANQAIHQVGLFGTSVRWASDLMIPEVSEAALRNLRQTACRAAGLAVARRGPVHLNVPLREPLAPIVVEADQAAMRSIPQVLLEGRADGAPWLRHHAGSKTPMPPEWKRILSKPRGLVVAGPLAPPSAVDWARRLGAAFLADPQFQPSAMDAVLASPKARSLLRPDWILHVGGSPTSKHWRHFVEEHADVPRLVVDPLGKAWDEAATATDVILGELDGIPTQEGDASWREAFLQLAAAAMDVRVEDDWEGGIASVLMRAKPDVLWAGSSLPIRDMDRYAAGTLCILSNRGASGIDGVVSGAAGAASAVGRCIAYVGDLTFLHDANALAAVKAYAPDLTIVVVNNGGGRIFEQLPIAQAISRDDFEALFATPQQVDLGALAAAFGVRHVRIKGTKGLDEAVSEPGLVEVLLDGKLAARRRKEHLQRIVAAQESLPWMQGGPRGVAGRGRTARRGKPPQGTRGKASKAAPQSIASKGQKRQGRRKVSR
jgi:2-succinyl-5-enolpyruvyl-6-hydroxy-3-cyclohexene-1-carboxylate synthase